MRPLSLANPPNPWHSSFVDYLGDPPPARERVVEDKSKSILSRNDSPDIPFRWSVNPYRGCQHACSYCYARPSHEQLGYGAGTDFDRIIVVKPQAAALLREAFLRRSWQGESITFSGNTDCYQPLEASYGLTRDCLEVCAEFRNPVSIITKAPLIERDLPLLRALSENARLTVVMSIAFWNEAHSRALEPYVATPSRRMKTVERLRAAGIDVLVLMAPLIPGLNDEDIGPLLQAAANAGATRASMGFLRLPGATREVFIERLRAALPLRAEKVLARVRDARGGALNDARFGARMKGEGHYADAVRKLFAMHARKLGLLAYRDEPDEREEVAASTFRRPEGEAKQLTLFK